MVLSVGWIARVAGHRHMATLQRYLLRYLVLVCIAFQTLNTCLLFAIPDPFRALPPSDPGYATKVVVLTIITLFQTVMFLGVMWVSIRLVSQVHNVAITPGFLIQSFLATALLFGGIYFVLFAATPNHQFSRHTAFDLTIFEVLYVFVHFSLTVMTTTGFGDVYARGIIARWYVSHTTHTRTLRCKQWSLHLMSDERAIVTMPPVCECHSHVRDACAHLYACRCAH
jgi:hypothetical protein